MKLLCSATNTGNAWALCYHGFNSTRPVVGSACRRKLHNCRLWTKGQHSGFFLCRHLQQNPASRGNSGEYIIKTDRLYFFHCDMELDCKGHKGWMKIADLNTTRGDSCPERCINTVAYKLCCTGGESVGCYSANFSTIGTHYTKVCGQMKGYQKGSVNGFYPYAYAHGTTPIIYKPEVTSRSIDGAYLDGVSITTERPRKYIWSYAVGTSDDYNFKTNCPCAVYPGPAAPTFVEQDYYCESGDTGNYNNNIFYPNDPLWDGKQCSAENNCCSQADMPWFFRHFITKQQGNIEVRICRDQAPSDEEVVIEELQLFVQ